MTTTRRSATLGHTGRGRLHPLARFVRFWGRAMKGENGTPETPDWSPQPKSCPFRNCGLCETPQQAAWRHQVLAEQDLPAEGVE